VFARAEDGGMWWFEVPNRAQWSAVLDRFARHSHPRVSGSVNTPDNRISERELLFGAGRPIVIRFQHELKVQHAAIPPEELEKYRVKDTTSRPKKPPGPL